MKGYKFALFFLYLFCKNRKKHNTMNDGASILRFSCPLCLSLLLSACKKDDDGSNRSPVFDEDATIPGQMYTQNVEPSPTLTCHKLPVTIVP